MSIPFRLIALAMVLLCSVTSVFSQTGCYVSTVGGAPQASVYITREPGSRTTPYVQFYSGNDFIPVDCPAGASSSFTHAVVLGDATGARVGCWAKRKPGAATAPNPNPNNAGEYDYNGVLVNYRTEQCPVDDYAPLLMLGLMGVGALMLRQMEVC